MRQLCLRLQLAFLVSLTVMSATLIILFGLHFRLISLHAQAELRRGGAVVAVIPSLGRVLDLLRRPAPLLGLVIMPAAVVIILELRHLWRSYARPGYNARLES